MRGARSLFRGTIFFFVAISLVTLFYLIVHAELADSNKMTAVKVTGFVDAKLKETGKVVALAERMKVGVGDEITTDSESSVELKLNDGSVIKIGADSKVIIKELGQVEVTKISKSTFKLVEGKIRAVVKPLIEKDSKFTIETDNATIGVRGTDFGVIFDLDLGNTEVLSIEDCISVVATNFPGLDAVDVCTKQELLISGVNVPGAVKAIAADKLEEFLKEMGIEGEGGEGEPTGEEDPPEITSAYINNRVNLEYLIGTLVVTKSDLNYEKKISVTGTAEDVKYKISKVEVSTDGGMTWGDATGGERWKFEFAPEDKMEYELMMRATNEKGITSDPDDFGSFEIKYLDITYEEIAKDFIDKFFNFLKNHDLSGISDLISDNYDGKIGDLFSKEELLDDSLERFFDTAQDLRLSYSINQVSFDGESIIVSTSWSASVAGVSSTGTTKWWLSQSDNYTLVHTEGKWFISSNPSGSEAGLTVENVEFSGAPPVCGTMGIEVIMVAPNIPKAKVTEKVKAYTVCGPFDLILTRAYYRLKTGYSDGFGGQFLIMESGPCNPPSFPCDLLSPVMYSNLMDPGKHLEVTFTKYGYNFMSSITLP